MLLFASILLTNAKFWTAFCSFSSSAFHVGSLCSDRIQIAAVKRDGSPLDPYNENRTINLVIEEKNENDDNLNRRTDVTTISRDTSVAEYWLYPKINTRKILVTVRTHGNNYCMYVSKQTL